MRVAPCCMSIILLGKQNSIFFFQSLSLGKDESISSSVINPDQLSPSAVIPYLLAVTGLEVSM